MSLDVTRLIFTGIYLCMCVYSFEQGSLGEMKSEAVALGGTANPLLAGLEHYVEASPPVVGLMKR